MATKYVRVGKEASREDEFGQIHQTLKSEGWNEVVAFRGTDAEFLEELKPYTYGLVWYEVREHYEDVPTGNISYWSGRQPYRRVHTGTTRHPSHAVIFDSKAEYDQFVKFVLYGDATKKALERFRTVISLQMVFGAGPGSGVSTPSGISLSRPAAMGCTKEAAESALAGMRGGGGHAIRKLQGSLIPNTGSLSSRVEAFKRIASPILEKPLHVANWRVGATQGQAFLGRISGRDLAIIVAKEGPHKGKVISAFFPDPSQLMLMLAK